MTGGAGWIGALMSSVERHPPLKPPGSSSLDPEHIVILMQERRSFDYTYGTLRGVRGFNDPRAVTLPNQHPVWLQSNAKDENVCAFSSGHEEHEGDLTPVRGLSEVRCSVGCLL
jgi:phospholipase C